MSESPLELEKVVEAILFVSESPMQVSQLLEIFEGEDFTEMEANAEELEAALEALKEKFSSTDYVYEVRKIDKGYQLFTKARYYPILRHATLMKNKRKLSRSALETLAIIAYRQPVTKSEVEFIRGVNCDYTVRKLLEKNLIEIQGRSDGPGRPLLYGTSPFFMEYFGLNDIKDLPRLEEFAVDEDQYQSQFKVYMKAQEEGEEETQQEENRDETREEGQGSEEG